MRLDDVLASLPALPRSSVTLVYVNGRTVSDAAKQLEVEPRAVSSALSVAFKVISAWLLRDIDSQHALPG